MSLVRCGVDPGDARAIAVLVHGRDQEYWERARELVGMEESAGSGQLEVPSPDDPSVMAGQAVEEASIQDNLGELPDRLSDQGEHPQTPSRANLKTP